MEESKLEHVIRPLVLSFRGVCLGGYKHGLYFGVWLG